MLCESWRSDGCGLRKPFLLAIHDAQIAEHGGAGRVRDLGFLRSAMARAQNFAAYEKPDISILATSYAFGIVRNHPFVDGNKRTARVVAELFWR